MPSKSRDEKPINDVHARGMVLNTPWMWCQVGHPGGQTPLSAYTRCHEVLEFFIAGG